MFIRCVSVFVWKTKTEENTWDFQHCVYLSHKRDRATFSDEYSLRTKR
jgi:hypothetical protein